MASEPVIFLASFPSIQSAIKVGDSGMRLQLDIPETEMANAVELLAMRNVVLKVTVEIAEKPKEGERSEKGLTRFSK
jgi:hypothetical protein